jgi:S1-C subfamily serine protease
MKALRRLSRLAFLVFGVGLLTFVTACASQPPTASKESRGVSAPTSFADQVLAAPALGVVVDQNLRVVDVESGSAAAAAGIRQGDVLEAIGGNPVNTSAKAVGSFRAAQVGDTLAVAVARGGQSLTLRVKVAHRIGHPGQPTPTAVPVDKHYF